MQTYSLFINGEWKASREKQQIINPANGKVIAEASIAGEHEVNAALEAARNAYDHGAWPRLSLAERKESLLKIAQGILDRAALLAQLETVNTGKPIKESTFMDIPSAAKTFEHFAQNLSQYLDTAAVDVCPDARAKLRREPHGVALLIAPWNYPLLIASWKIAQALAAGNCVIVKPSSLTPATTMELASIIQAAGLPAGTVNVLNGPGPKIGDLLCADKRVDMISFTGSSEVGRHILESTSRSVKKMIMELGGKSAGIVLNDADLELAVHGSLCSIFLNQGQMCTGMSRIFVQSGIYERFLEEFLKKAQRIKLGDGMNYETQMGPLISDAQRKKVIAAIEKAKIEGATVACGGEIPDEAPLRNGFFFPPTVLTGVLPSMGIFKEEVFGPVVCIQPFSDLGEAVELANKTDFGLASCVWTADSASAEKVSAGLNAGTVWVNTYGMFYNQVPYGGFKQSGFGKELGREGFLEYTRLKNIVTDTTQGAKPLVNYWYGF